MRSNHHLWTSNCGEMSIGFYSNGEYDRVNLIAEDGPSELRIEGSFDPIYLAIIARGLLRKAAKTPGYRECHNVRCSMVVKDGSSCTICGTRPPTPLERLANETFCKETS